MPRSASDRGLEREVRISASRKSAQETSRKGVTTFPNVDVKNMRSSCDTHRKLDKIWMSGRLSVVTFAIVFVNCRMGLLQRLICITVRADQPRQSHGFCLVKNGLAEEAHMHLCHS